jgi:antitoxin component YwqK of YwqJK toxin-antitoxin module
MLKFLKIFLFLTCVNQFVNGQNICLSDLEFENSLYYKNGELYSGTYTCNNDEKKVKEQGVISNGLIDSLVFFKGNGEMSEIIWYKDNQPLNRRLYRNAGTTNLVINLKDNVEHGSWERFYLNGQLNEQCFYDNGEPIGVWKTWDRNGIIIMESDLTNDTIVVKFHGYTKNKHKMLIRYTDKKTKKKIRQEKIVLPL